MIVTMEPMFSESGLEERLRQLGISSTLAFGAACGERMLACYRKFSEECGWGNEAKLRAGLDLIWGRALSCEAWSDKEVSQVLEACLAAAPDSDDFTSLYTSSAQDTVFGICGLLEFLLDGELGKAVLAARYPTDSIDLLVQEFGGLDPGDPDLEAKILASSLMQQELRRQRRDLEEVASLDSSHVASLRGRAGQESILDKG